MVYQPPGLAFRCSCGCDRSDVLARHAWDAVLAVVSAKDRRAMRFALEYGELDKIEAVVGEPVVLRCDRCGLVHLDLAQPPLSERSICAIA